MTLVPLPRAERAAEAAADLSGAAAFAACLRLFRLHPLAVTQDRAAGAARSMTLTRHAGGRPGLFVLDQPGEDHFVLRAWTGQGWAGEEIRPESPVSRMTRQSVATGVPVPRDGALLGWALNAQVTALLSVHHRRPDAGGDPGHAAEIRVMPDPRCIDPLDWPPFAASPLGDRRLWEYLERGWIVDVAPLVSQRDGQAFWVPAPDIHGVRCGAGCIVITSHLAGDEHWLPDGVYLDHWVLREGIKAPPAARLLSLSGVVDLGRSLR